MERLKQLKGGTAELVLFVRLALLSSIAAFHSEGMSSNISLFQQNGKIDFYYVH